MKSLVFLSVFLLLGNTLNAQNIDSLRNKSQVTDHRLTEDNLMKEHKGMYRQTVPSYIIILNYNQIISMTEYQQVKGNGDIIKEYVIENKSPNASEVEKIRIVESKNKDKYKDFGIKE